jgi:ubiquinone/menaquinone biosynthesis C-methylase UbiE
MGFYTDQFLPRFTEVALGRTVEATRARVVAGLSGEVLELGFGSGRNLPHASGAVRRYLAVEPALVCRKLAAPRVAAAPFPVEWVGLDGQDIPLEDESVDHVLTTWTLCTIPDVERALQETRRVLRPGGTFHFVEHGRSPKPQVAKWQDRMTPLWGRLFGGCHLNRPTDSLIQAAGLTLDSLRTYNMGGPETIGFAFEGTAKKLL